VRDPASSLANPSSAPTGLCPSLTGRVRPSGADNGFLGGSAFLRRRTALALHGVRLVNLREIELAVVVEHTPRHVGRVVHRTRVTPEEDEIRLLDGLRVASPSLALLESASRETDQELDRLIAELARRRGATPPRTPRRSSGISPPGCATSTRRSPRRSATSCSAPGRSISCGPRSGSWWKPTGSRTTARPGELERGRVKDAWLRRHNHRVLRVTGFRFTHDRAGIHEDLAAMLRST
jgi:hypothetical protein